MEIAEYPIEQVIPYARNPRDNGDAVEKVASSIAEFGFRQPVVVDPEMVVIVGHTRLEAAKRLGWSRVPVHIARDLSDAQARAYRLADNRLHQDSDWDTELLKLEIGDLQEADFDLAFTGFEGDELEQLLAEALEEGNTDEDETPEVQEEAVTVTGDTWLLGKHRVRCGDATCTSDWDALRIESGFVCFTSPPYNLGDAAKWRSGDRAKDQNAYDHYTDDVPEEEYRQFLQDITNVALTFCDAAVINVQPLAKSKRPLLRWMDYNADHVVDIVTWDKGTAAPQMQAGILASRYEWLTILSAESPANRVVPMSSWQGKYQNVYSGTAQKDSTYSGQHAATFPVHLPEFVLGDLMNRSRGVVDCCAGTGTTVVAAEKLGRECAAIELSPNYVDVIVKRWQDFTGKQATLEGDGRSFDEVADERFA